MYSTKNSFNPVNREMTFRKWTNKPYAVFNSLKKIIKIARLNVTYSLVLVGTATSFAQTDSLRIDKRLELTEYEIISTVEPLIFNQKARIVNVISKTDILQSGHSDIAGIIKFEHGMDIRQRGGFGIQNDISLRGSTFDQVLVLINGIPFSDAQTGHFNLNLPLSSENIERVEIIEGAAARIYGPNAFAGAINIVTQPSGKNTVNIRTEIGEYGYYNGLAMINLAGKRNRTTVSYQKSSSKGYMENTDFQLQNFFIQSLFISKKFNVDVQLGANTKEFGANGFYSAKYPLQFEKNALYFGNTSLNFGKKLITLTSIFWRQHQDNWILTKSNPALYQNFHQTDTYGFKTNHRFKSKLGKTLLGSEFKSESIWSTSLGEKQDVLKPIPWSSENNFSHHYERLNASFFIDHQIISSPRFYAAFGFLTNWNTDFNQKLKLYPGIDFSYKISSGFNLIASANQAMRLPTFTDLFYSGPANLGNPNLLPEKSTSFELGIKFEKQFIKAEVVYFNRFSEDVIDWVWIESLEKWQTQNIHNQNIAGLQTSIKHASKENAFINALSLSYTYLNMHAKEIPLLTKYASTHLKHQLNIGGSFQLFQNIFLNLDITYRDRVGVYQTFNFENQTYGQSEYQAIVLLDTKIKYQKKHYSIFIDALNLTNQVYFENGILQAGRWIKGGVLFNFDLIKNDKI